MTKRPKAAEETTVLVVEDEPRLCDVLVSSAAECGFRAGAAGSAEEALRQMESEPRDIVLLDLNLPCMDGLQYFEILRNRWPTTSVVILTGFGTLAAAQRAIQLGVIEFLTKPASLGEIERALHRAWRAGVGAREPEAVEEPPIDETPQASAASDVDSLPTMSEIEHDCVVAALERHNGNRAAAAAELGISIRTLYYRLAGYKMDPSRGRP